LPIGCCASTFAHGCPAYVAPPGGAGVEDFDSRVIIVDVTYCPNSHIAFAERPLKRFEANRGVGVLWHSACSLFGKRRIEDRIGQEQEERKNSSTNKQASDQ
jgi:hypothetical protein